MSGCERLSVRSLQRRAKQARLRHLTGRERTSAALRYSLSTVPHTRVHAAVSVLFIHAAAAAAFSYRTPSAPSLQLRRHSDTTRFLLHPPVSVAAAAAAE